MGTLAHRVLMTALLSGIAALVAVNWQLLTTSIDISPKIENAANETEGPSSSANMIAPVAPLTTKDGLAETLDRPVFNPSRRPDVVEPSDPAAASTSPESDNSTLKLVGMMQWGANRRALIRVSGEPYARWVEIGGHVNGWKLRAIEGDFVVVEQNDRRQQIKLAIKQAQSETEQP